MMVNCLPSVCLCVCLFVDGESRDSLGGQSEAAVQGDDQV